MAVLAVGIATWLAFAPALLNDGDTSWHLATGRWILEHRAIPHVDPFSSTFRGHAWTAHEWLVDVLMAGVHGLAGWAGITLLFSIPIAAAIVLVGRQVSAVLPWQRAIAVAALLTAVLAPFMLARPHVLAWPLLAVWTIALVRARDAGRAPPLAMSLLILLWANLHASFIFAILLAGLFGLEALIAGPDRRQVMLRWGGFGLLLALFALATPHGVQGLLYPFQVSGMSALPLIDEWRPTSLRKDWLFVLFAVGVAVVAALRWRSLTILRFLLLGLLAEMAFAHARHQPLFAIVSVIILARPAAIDGARHAVGAGRAVAVAAGAVLLLAVVRLSMPFERSDSRTYPASAIASVPAEFRTQPVLNSYSFGGPLILSGIAPFIDGRADMYGDTHTIDHRAMMDGDLRRLDAAMTRWHLRWTILHPQEKLVRVLDRDSRWRRQYADDFAVVHVRVR